MDILLAVLPVLLSAFAIVLIPLAGDRPEWPDQRFRRTPNR